MRNDREDIDYLLKEMEKLKVAQYQIGDIYITTDDTDPAIKFGYGEWEAFGAGKSLVAIDTGDTDFDTVEETGGAKTHTLTVSEMPSHNHGGSTSSNNAYNTTSVYGSSGSTNHVAQQWGGNYIGADSTYQSRTIHSHTISSQGGGSAHSIMNPYIVVYMWKRTA